MDCLITIDVSSLVVTQNSPDEPPSSIQVSGTAVECKILFVQLSAGSVTAAVTTIAENEVWTAIFNAPTDFSLGDFECGMNNISIIAECQDNNNCDKTESIIETLECRPSECPLQASYMVYRNGNPNDVADPNECLTPGNYTVRVTDPYASEAFYQWSLNWLTQPGASGPGQNEFQITLSAGDSPQMVSVVVMLSVDCFPSTGVMLTLCETPPPPPANCPNSVALAVSQAGTPVPDLSGCLEPGSYTITVTDPVNPNTIYSWSVNNVLQQGQTGAAFTLNLPAGETRSVQVSATRPNCPTVPGSVTLAACAGEPVPQPDCPTSVTLQVVDDRRQPVQTDECLPPGRYTVVVTEPAGAGVSYTWMVNGQPQTGQNGRTYSLNLAPDQATEIAVLVQVSGCDELRERVTLTGCPEDRPSDCADGVTLVVLDANGDRVNTSNCLPPGRYQVRVDAPVGAGVSYVWSLNDLVQPGQTGQSLNVTLTENQTVNVSVSAGQSGCGPVPAGVTLAACVRTPPPPPPPPPWCPWLYFGGLFLLIIGLVLTFAGFCSGNIPLAVVGIVMAVVGFALLIAWALLCGAAAGGCELFRRLLILLGYLVILMGVIGAFFLILAAICALITSPTGILLVLCGLPGACGIGLAIDLGIVGVLLGVLMVIYFAICD